MLCLDPGSRDRRNREFLSRSSSLRAIQRKGDQDEARKQPKGNQRGHNLLTKDIKKVYPNDSALLSEKTLMETWRVVIITQTQRRRKEKLRRGASGDVRRHLAAGRRSGRNHPT